MGSQTVKLFSLLAFVLFSVASSAMANCLQVAGEYSIKDEASGEITLLHVEQKECKQVNIVYDYGESGKSARIMMFNNRPVVYIDDLNYNYYETSEINADRITTHAVEIDLKKIEEIHTTSQITLDQNKNWVEEGDTYTKNHEREKKHFKMVYKRLN
jgi:hypothetical protein